MNPETREWITETLGWAQREVNLAAENEGVLAEWIQWATARLAEV